MSGPDQGDEGKSFQDKSFLARWSQRKQEAKQPDRDVPAAEANVAPAPVAEGDVPQEFDLSSLPKLEEITSTTDITAFLRRGVPEHLRNAALRKSWALDPAIRNYVNPALDYAYDWNTPGGVPGSSEIGAGMDVARLVSQIMQTLCAARLVVEVAGAEPSYVPARPLETITCHDILLAMRASQGQELATRDEPTRLEVYGEFNRIQEAERHAASAVSLLALVNRAQAQAARRIGG